MKPQWAVRPWMLWLAALLNIIAAALVRSK